MKLTETEMHQLYSYAKDAFGTGDYYGNKERYERRHYRILAFLDWLYWDTPFVKKATGKTNKTVDKETK